MKDAFKRYQLGVVFESEIEPALKINSDWNKILPLIQKQKLGIRSILFVGCPVVYYINAIKGNRTEKNCKNFIAAAAYYIDTFANFMNADIFNLWSWTLFEYSKEKDELKQALEWIKRSNDLRPADPYIMDTYANILYKLGLVHDAIVWQKKAVEQLELKGQNSLAIQQIKKMEKGSN